MEMQHRKLSAGVIVAVLTLGLQAGALSPATAQTGADRRTITVDAGRTVGVLKAFTGYNGAPEQPARALPPLLAPGQTAAPPQAAMDPKRAAELFRQVGITESRTHDSNGGDTMYGERANLNVIFPDKNADPTKPESYNFSPTDQVITSMVENGVEPFFRVGDGHDGFVPDFDKYSEVVRHIVLHYNKGWANGFRYNIKHWEFWNEPDFTLPGRAQFWAGNEQQYFEFYGKAVKAIKEADPSVLVGGPSTASDTAVYQGPFLKYLRDHKLPLDFYSYHYYSVGSSDPYDVVRMTDKSRAAMKQYGFGAVPIMITEFGYDLYEPTTGAQRPAFFSAELGYMQDTTMDRAYYHSAGVGRLFTAQGITPAGAVFQAHASLQATPQRLAATGGDDVGFHVLAGRATKASSDTDQEIRIIVTNYEVPPDKRGPYENGKGIPTAAPYKGDLVLNFPGTQVSLNVLPRRNPTYVANRGYELTIKNLPTWAALGYTVNRYRLDNTHAMPALIDSQKRNERTLSLSADLPAPAMELIVIRSNAAGPPTREGVWNLRSLQP
jgi:hypothetical protein